MQVKDCTVGGMYVRYGVPFKLVGCDRTKNQFIFLKERGAHEDADVERASSLSLKGDDLVHEVVMAMDDLWVRWHEGVTPKASVHHFNHDSWVRTREL